jgi:hypothetical protein
LSGGGALNNNVTLNAVFSSSLPLALGAAAAGVANVSAREDHVHPAVDLASTIETTGVLGMVSGGTGVAHTAPAAGAIAYSDGSGIQLSTVGLAGQVLVSQGASAPNWGSALIVSDQPANYFYAGPTSGPDAPTAFRSMVNADLQYSSLTINGNSVSLGGSTTVTATATNALTIGTGLSGTSYNGSAAVTVAIASTGVTAASVGSASKTLTATVNAQGQLTALADTNIAISNTQVSGLGSAALLTAGAAGGVATLDGGNGSGGTSNVTVGSGLTFSAGTLSASGGGDVVGPASSTDNAIARFDLTTGKLLQNSTVTVTDNGDVSNANSVVFDITPTTLTTAQGTLYWDNADSAQTLSLVMEGGNAVQQIGEEQYFRIKCSAAVTEGQVVMFTGTVGSSGGLTGAPATGLTAANASYLMGVATESGALNDWIYVTSFGLVRNIDTTGGAESWVDGDILYYNPAVTGGLTKTLPSAPNAKVQVCAVVHAASNGSLFIRPSFGGILGQYEGDVGFTSTAAGDLIRRNSGNTAWENVATIPNTQVSGLGTMSTQAASSVAITGGSINGTTIGGSTAAAGTFTTCTATSFSGIDGGTF